MDMAYTLIYLAVLMIVVVWWLVKQTVSLRPWVAAPAADTVRSEGVRSPMTEAALPSSKLALGVFLAVATSLFALFISAYSIRMEYGDWRPMPEPMMLWINSGILVLSSAFLQYAWNSAKRQNEAGTKFGVLAGGSLALAFVIGQLLAWQQLSDGGYGIAENPANAFFYTLTGVHAIHLAGGIFALLKTVRRVWRNDSSSASVELGVELCTIYWHYLLAIWVILFSFMLTT
ncbi:MAG: cytochrome-c oxidase [Pseudomonadales bacterium]|nr:cytochrome-c oxidase [Pseudomonadales bacterium]